MAGYLVDPDVYVDPATGEAFSYAAGNVAANTQHFRGIVAADGTTVTIEILVGMPNTIRESADRVTITLTKSSTTLPFAITNVQLLGV